jgi:hypothetical protein
MRARKSLGVVLVAVVAIVLAAGAGAARAASASPATGTESVAGTVSAATGQCSFEWPNGLGACSSANPAVKVESLSEGDTSGCSFGGTASWGDGAREDFSFNGAADGTVFDFANHAYKAAGTYAISVSDEVLSGPCSWGGFTVSFTYSPAAQCAAGTQASGSAWVSRFPDSKRIADLRQPFRGDVAKFISAMKDAGIKQATITTLRPPERAYLMHYSWLVAKKKLSPQRVPAFAPRPGQAPVSICWVHTTATGAIDVAGSVAAAAQMARAYRIDPKLAVAPSLTSLHTQGLAIDMTTTWTKAKITIKEASGKKATISTTPRTGLNKQLIAIGATYHVIHFKNAAKDANHWSTNGR